MVLDLTAFMKECISSSSLYIIIFAILWMGLKGFLKRYFHIMLCMDRLRKVYINALHKTPVQQNQQSCWYEMYFTNIKHIESDLAIYPEEERRNSKKIPTIQNKITSGLPLPVVKIYVTNLLQKRSISYRDDCHSVCFFIPAVDLNSNIKHNMAYTTICMAKIATYVFVHWTKRNCVICTWKRFHWYVTRQNSTQSVRVRRKYASYLWT